MSLDWILDTDHTCALINTHPWLGSKVNKRFLVFYSLWVQTLSKICHQALQVYLLLRNIVIHTLCTLTEGWNPSKSRGCENRREAFLYLDLLSFRGLNRKQKQKKKEKKIEAGHSLFPPLTPNNDDPLRPNERCCAASQRRLLRVSREREKID